ncbi:unnamed protein product [Rotaria sp. Silwood2]|nr:unnamed protein product [Rotaria sp. Silwood2]CAF2995073.1 unnamed protein product [Rotaria sp. Silwood2]CAF3316390.1 unnamed protein product [Rotaria sp. Silwood2]CAF3336207.1 unnamed protein product [Rotaria sp. Silwood2]CAF4070650.1 unnamed protein product [Rotaria sp. Silwood2]
MNTATLKQLIEHILDIHSDHQRLIFRKQQVEDSKALSEYKIEHQSMIHLTLTLRGGIYHFTSGGEDFLNVLHGTVEAIKNVLAFEFKHMNQSENFSVSNDLPHLKNIILLPPFDNEDENNGKKDDMSNE